MIWNRRGGIPPGACMVRETRIALRRRRAADGARLPAEREKAVI